MSYIGSKINVTTTAGNQYDGILTAIKPSESTIELQQVRQVSAQGKKVSSDGRVFDFVVFKSDDIKDLFVYENEKISEDYADPALSDPAIVSHSLDPRTKNNRSAEIQFGSIDNSISEKISFGSISEPSLVVNSKSLAASSFASAVTANQPSASPVPTFTPSSRQSTQKVIAYSTVTKKATQVDVPVQQPRGPIIPDNEYDFEGMNQAFEKDQTATAIDNSASVYNRTISFFDNISSEAISMEARNERSWNMETFGQAYVRGSNRGARGRGSRGHRHIHRHATGSF